MLPSRGLCLALLCLLQVMWADSKGGRKGKTKSSEPCAALGRAAAVQGGSASARYNRIIAYAECLREKKDFAGMVKVLGRMASDAVLKASQPLAVTNACNQVAEGAMEGHISWDEADTIFR